MNWEVVGIVLLALAALAWSERRGPIPYRGRACTGRAWRRAYPAAPKDQIRSFLLCSTDGMAFSSETKLKFHPNDQVLDVYRSIYGGQTPLGDHMECETFLENVSREFGCRLESLLAVWHSEVTLGDLFALAGTQQTVATDRREDAGPADG